MLVPGQYGISEQSAYFAIGDYDGDGKPAVVIASSRGIDVLSNLGRGAFRAAIHTDSPRQSSMPVLQLIR